MKPENIFVQLDKVLQNQHAVYGSLNIDHLSKAGAEIQRLYSNGSFHADFFHERIRSFRYAVLKTAGF
jgi:hypothetical protein